MEYYQIFTSDNRPNAIGYFVCFGGAIRASCIPGIGYLEKAGTDPAWRIIWKIRYADRYWFGGAAIDISGCDKSSPQNNNPTRGR